LVRGQIQLGYSLGEWHAAEGRPAIAREWFIYALAAARGMRFEMAVKMLEAQLPG
jgi:hypothetical protein